MLLSLGDQGTEKWAITDYFVFGPIASKSDTHFPIGIS
jgi:hypothetical protein